MSGHVYRRCVCVRAVNGWNSARFGCAACHGTGLLPPVGIVSGPISRAHGAARRVVEFHAALVEAITDPEHRAVIDRHAVVAVSALIDMALDVGAIQRSAPAPEAA